MTDEPEGGGGGRGLYSYVLRTINDENTKVFLQTSAKPCSQNGRDANTSAHGTLLQNKAHLATESANNFTHERWWSVVACSVVVSHLKPVTFH